MINTEVRVIKLSCISCGSNLDISQSMNKLACGHCGTQQIVERSGGAIHLRGVAEALSKVQVGTDKTAAELAISRLTKELEAVQYQRAEKEQDLLNIRTQKLYDWNAFIIGRKRTVNWITVITVFLSYIPLILATNINSGFLYFLCLIVLIGTPIFVRKAIKKTDKYNPNKLQAQCNVEFAKLDRQIANELGVIDKRIVSLNGRLQQNYQVANA